jgi:hypothetical protein
LTDALALVAFVAIGNITHDTSAAAFARDTACFLGAWFVVALGLRTYASPHRLRLGVTWLVGVTAAVAVRAILVGHFSAVFYGVALGFTAIFITAGRLLLRRRAAGG